MTRLKIISIDELKKALPEYSPQKADEFHRKSAKIADKLFDQELKKIKNQKVVLMCGGSASGKSEFIEKFFITEKFGGLIFDSTLSKIDGAEIKIKKIKKSGNSVVICLILPDDLRRCFAAFNKRDRKIPEDRFYETHCGSRQVAAFLAKEFLEIEILVYESLYEFGSEKNDPLFFREKLFRNRREMINFLERNLLSKEEIKTKIIEAIKGV